jgi:outer membrane protein OmpA-like peptidoglycan-associated protein
MRMLPFIVAGSLAVTGIASADDRQPDAEVFFRSDSAALDAQALRVLDEVADEMRDDPYLRLRLDAYTDDSGAEPYNVRLALQRAKAITRQLARLGVDKELVVIAAYGEAGTSHGSAAKDRRVAITMTDESLHAIIVDALPGATTVVWNEPVTLAELEGAADEEIERTSRR